MARRHWARLFAAGAMLAALAACDQINDRLDKFGKLTGDVLNQVNGGEAAQDPLLTASVEERALFGVQQAPIELQPISLDELLQTQSFFAVGSVIAMPKVEMTEPVVEAESFDLAAADPAAPEAPADAAAGAALNTKDAPLPESAEKPAGAPVAEAPAAAAAPPPTTTVPVPNAPSRQMTVRSMPGLKAVTAGELRQQSQVIAPRALEKAMKDTGVTVSREQLRIARSDAEAGAKATSQTAQAIGDEVARKSLLADSPIPKVLAARSKLKVDVALAARQKVENRIQQMGLSGIVTPEEGGQMRILIGVKPTQLGLKRIDPTNIDAVRSMFAKAKEKMSDECSGTVSAQAVQADPVLATECVVKVLRESGEYQYVEKDYIFTNQFSPKPKAQKPAGLTPNDPLFGLQWHYKANGNLAGQSGGGAGFQDFWTKSKLTGSRNVTVAVVDTGIQMNHPDIKGSPNLAAGYDMVSDPVMGNDGDGRDADPNDPGDKCDLNNPDVSDTFHGTHVAGTIGVAATNNASGIAGGAWDVTIVPVRALGRCGGKLSDINDAIRWAAGIVPARDGQGNEVWNSKPADVINLSIGLFEPCPASMQAAINDAVAKGAVVVAAAGNARVDAKYFAPGGCQNVISVAAGDARGQLTPYSNFGENVTIMAPGGDMSRDDDGDGRPDGILSTKFSKSCYDPAKPATQVSQCYYAYENGTSMAAPHVSAALALIKAKFPSAVPSDLRSKLMTATMPRDALQCSGKCSTYPGTTPIPGSDGLCSRPCGGKMLNLANAPVQ
jgi:serine protease